PTNKIKTGAVTFASGSAFNRNLKTSLTGTEGPYPMAPVAGKGFTWGAFLSSLTKAPSLPAGTVVLAHDFYIPELVPLGIPAGTGIIVSDNFSTREKITVTSELTNSAGLTLDSVAKDGFPIPNYLDQVQFRDGTTNSGGISPDAPAYAFRVTATDEAGN